MRDAIHSTGWRKVYDRVQGSTFAVCASEAFKVPELEVVCSGARFSELDAKGGMLSKKGGIFRFDITPPPLGAPPTTGARKGPRPRRRRAARAAVARRGGRLKPKPRAGYV